MSIFFAHNGIDHANHMEATAHQSGVFSWIILLTVGLAVAFYILKKSRATRPNKAEGEEK